ncbi:RICIN domain-containing protein [Streptomyces avicenniae]|uniref:RICIN domain-containing protein n=1 Tax=Streptomyces avicenniae TaxID=500153 RepID=UPI00069CA282|nr:RICIN domain-containing protein [Streptomyces avicenniae]
MTPPSRRGRPAFVAAFAALLLVCSGALSTANAAPTYWTFKSQGNGKCLTASSSSSVWVASCSGATSQQWDWVGPGVGAYHQLKNRATGQCLRTDGRTARNAVWTTVCDHYQGEGQHWSYQSGVLFTYSYNTQLRTTPSGTAAVYTSDMTSATDDIPLAHYEWRGTHN